MSCGIEEQHPGITEDFVHEKLQELAASMICLNIPINSILRMKTDEDGVHTGIGTGIDRVSKVPHPDYFKLARVDLYYERKDD